MKYSKLITFGTVLVLFFYVQMQHFVQTVTAFWGLIQVKSNIRKMCIHFLWCKLPFGFIDKVEANQQSGQGKRNLRFHKISATCLWYSVSNTNIMTNSNNIHYFRLIQHHFQPLQLTKIIWNKGNHEHEVLGNSIA